MPRRLGAALGASLPLHSLAVLVLVGACDKVEPRNEEGPLALGTAPSEEVEGLFPKGVPAPPSTRPASSDAASGPSRTDAPLLYWMREHTAAGLRLGDTAGLAEAFDQLAAFAPPGPAYDHWASIARDGADAARAASLEGVRAACRGCHGQYRGPYRAELRARFLGPSDASQEP